MSKNRFSRKAAVVACSVLIGAFGFTAPAAAHIGASHAPFNTDGLDLLSARIIGTTVRACFDGSIDAINDESDFDTYSYDSYADHVFTFAGGDGVINPDDDKCIDLDGSDNESLDQARIFTAGGNSNDGAVEDSSGNGNSAGAVALTGGVDAAAMHETDAPELLTAARVGTTDRARYGFDEPVDTGDAPDPTRFGFEDNTGTSFYGTTMLVTDDNEVEITFTGAAATALPNARQFFVLTNDLCRSDSQAVWDLGITDGAGPNIGAKFNVLDTIATGTPAGRTDDPDVTGVDVFDGNQIDYMIDERIDDTTVREDCFVAYEADGDSHEGESFDIISNSAAGATVRVNFNLNGETEQVAIAAADRGAVTADDDGDHSSRASFDLSDRLEPGYSDGPDVEQAIPNVNANRMTVCFDTDESIDGSSVDPSAFDLIKRDGTGQTDFNFADGDTFLGTGPENCVTIGYDDDGPDAVQRAIAVHVNYYGTSIGLCDNLPSPENNNRTGMVSDSCSNEEVGRATVGVGGPPPTGVTPPPGPPGPPAPPGTPPGTPTVRTGLCDANRATAPLAELLIGDNAANQICGFGGNDTLRGLNGADSLRGGPGKDIHAGGKGKDTIKGARGRDVLRGGKGPDVLSDRKGKNSFIGGKGNDLCKGRGTFKGCETIRQRGR